MEQTGCPVHTEPTTSHTQSGSQLRLRLSNGTFPLKGTTNLWKFWEIPTTGWLPQQAL
ncbi:hypothetical protein SynSYN20_01226 [Synechococcus sp. SYN20]|nr:hypothetical protein SynSYN20_01226 [Synechococcus sp. SYN20]